MTQYYVNPSGGNNNNSGLSTSQAWASVSRAQQSPVSAGDVVNLMSGNYGNTTFSGSDVKGNSGNWITYRMYPGHGDHSAIFGRILFTGNYNWYIRVEGIRSYVTSSSRSNLECYDSSYVVFSGCKAGGSLYGYGPSYAIVLFDMGANNCRVEYCELYNGDSGTLAAVQIDFSNWCVASHNYIHDMPGTALRVGNDTGGVTGARNTLLEYNIIHTQRTPTAHGGSGVTTRSEYLTVRGNIIYNFGSSWPIALYHSVHGSDGYSNITIENNVIYHITGYTNQWMHGVTMKDAGVNLIFRNNTFLHYWVSGYADAYVQFSYAQSSHLSTWKIYNNIFETNCQIWASSSLCSNIQQGNNIFNSSGGSTSTRGLFINGSKVSSFPGGNNGSFWLSNFSAGVVYQEREQAYPFGSIYPFELCSGSPAINAGNTPQAPTLDLLERSRVGTADIGAYEYDGEPPQEPETLYVNVSDDIDVAEITSTQKEGGTYQVDIYEDVTVDETEIVDVGPKKVNVSDSVSVADILIVDAPEGETALKFVNVTDTITIVELLPDRYVFGPVLLTISVTESITIQEVPKAVNESLLGGGFPNWYLATTNGSYASGKAYTSDDAGENWTEISPADADFAIRVYGAAAKSPAIEISIAEPISVGETVDREEKSADLHLAYPASTITVSDIVSLNIIAAYGVQPIDSVSVAETVTLLRTTLREIDIADTISVAETVGVGKSLNVSVVETIAVAETIQNLILDLSVSALDSVSVVSSIGLLIPQLYNSIVGAVGIYDFTTIHLLGETYIEVIDSVNVADTVSMWVSDVDALVAETVIVAETVATKLTSLNVGVTDTVSVADTPTLAKVGGLHDVNVADTVSVAESVLASMSELNIFEADSISVIDEILRIFQNPIGVEIVELVVVQDILSRLNTNPLDFYVDDKVSVLDWGDSEKIAILKEATDLVTVGETIDLRISKPGWAKRPPRKPHPIHPRDVRYS